MTETVIAGEINAGEAAQVRAELEALISSVDKSTFDIAEKLYQVKSHAFYQPTFNTFKEFTDSLKIKARKAQYLTRIVEVFTEVGVPRTQYEPLGIARLREISSLDPKINWKNPETGVETPMSHFIKSFVEKGEEIEMDDLKQHVRTLKGFTGENDIVWHNWPFTRQVSENIIAPALALAKANIGSVGKDDEGISQDASDSRCIEVWAVEYLNDVNSNPLNQGFMDEVTDEAEIISNDVEE